MTQEPSYARLIAEARADDRSLIEVEYDGPRALVRMCDPERFNPLSAVLTVQLRDRLQTLVADPNIGAVILTGADPAFSAGGDIQSMRDIVQPLIDNSADGAADMWRWIRYQFGGIVRLISHTDKLFIAAINGPAAGVGLAIALACDLRIAADRARLHLAFGQIGLLPEVGTCWLLTRRLGRAKTLELFLSGAAITAEQAEDMGLVNEVVAHDALLARAQHWVDKALALPPHALAMTKPLLRQTADMTWDQAIAMEEFAEPIGFTTRTHRAAVAAFLAKQSRSR